MTDSDNRIRSYKAQEKWQQKNGYKSKTFRLSESAVKILLEYKECGRSIHSVLKDMIYTSTLSHNNDAISELLAQEKNIHISSDESFLKSIKITKETEEKLNQELSFWKVPMRAWFDVFIEIVHDI